MSVISVYNQKGGTGKTSLTVLLGRYASKQGKRVLLIDLDPQESLTQTFLPENEGMTVYSWISEKDPSKIIKKVEENLFLMPGDLRLLKLQSGLGFNWLKNHLPNEFDLIFLDNSPSYNSIIISSLVASQKVIIPSLQSNYDIKSLLFTLDVIDENNQGLERVVIWNRQTKLTKELEKMSNHTEIKNCKQYYLMNSVSIRKVIQANSLEKNKRLLDNIASIYGGIL